MAFTESQIIQAGGAINNNKAVQTPSQHPAPNPSVIKLNPSSYSAAVSSESASANYSLLPSPVSITAGALQKAAIASANADVANAWNQFISSQNEMNALMSKLAQYYPSGKNTSAAQLLSEYVSQFNSFNSQIKIYKAEKQKYEAESASAESAASGLTLYSGAGNSFSVSGKALPFYKNGETYQQFLSGLGFSDVNGTWEFEPSVFNQLSTQYAVLSAEKQELKQTQQIVNQFENIYNNQYLPAVHFLQPSNPLVQNATVLPAGYKSYEAASVIGDLAGTNGSVINVMKNGLLQINPFSIPSIPSTHLGSEGTGILEAYASIKMISSNSGFFSNPSNLNSSSAAAAAKKSGISAITGISQKSQANTIINQELAKANAEGEKAAEEVGIIGAGTALSIVTFGTFTPIFASATGSILVGGIAGGALSGAVGSTGSMYVSEAFGNRYTPTQIAEQLAEGAAIGGATGGITAGALGYLKGIDMFNSFATPKIVETAPIAEYVGYTAEYDSEVFGDVGSIQGNYNVVRNGNVIDTLKLNTYAIGGKSIGLEGGGYTQNVLAKIYISSAQNGDDLNILRGVLNSDFVEGSEKGGFSISTFRNTFLPQTINGYDAGNEFSLAFGEMTKPTSFQIYSGALKAAAGDSEAQFLDFNELVQDLDEAAADKGIHPEFPSRISARLQLYSNEEPQLSFRQPLSSGAILTRNDNIVNGIFLQGSDNDFIFSDDEFQLMKELSPATKSSPLHMGGSSTDIEGIPSVHISGSSESLGITATKTVQSPTAFAATLPQIQSSILPSIAQSYVAEVPSSAMSATFFSGSAIVDPIIQSEGTSTIAMPSISPTTARISEGTSKTSLYPTPSLSSGLTITPSMHKGILESFPSQISVAATKEALFPPIEITGLSNINLLESLGNSQNILVSRQQNLLGSAHKTKNILGNTQKLISASQNILSNAFRQQNIEEEQELEQEQEIESTAPSFPNIPFFDLEEPSDWFRKGALPLTVMPPFLGGVKQKANAAQFDFAQPHYVPSLGAKVFDITAGKKALQKQNGYGGALNSGFIRPIIS